MDGSKVSVAKCHERNHNGDCKYWVPESAGRRMSLWRFLLGPKVKEPKPVYYY